MAENAAAGEAVRRAAVGVDAVSHVPPQSLHVGAVVADLARALLGAALGRVVQQPLLLMLGALVGRRRRVPVALYHRVRRPRSTDVLKGHVQSPNILRREQTHPRPRRALRLLGVRGARALGRPLPGSAHAWEILCGGDGADALDVARTQRQSSLLERASGADSALSAFWTTLSISLIINRR